MLLKQSISKDGAGMQISTNCKNDLQQKNEEEEKNKNNNNHNQSINNNIYKSLDLIFIVRFLVFLELNRY